MVNWLVIGIGDITAKRVIPAILAEPRSRLAGFVTRDPAKAAVYSLPGWTSLAEGIAASECDAVYVASPVYLHAPHTIEALRAAKHVLCEKPTAMHYAQACEMQRVAEESGRVYGVAYYRRRYPAIERARQLLEWGAIGHAVFAELLNHDWFHPVTRFRSWLVEPEKAGGGPLYDIASHRIDLLNYLFGNPVAASGHLSAAVHQARVEDAATVVIKYANGVHGVVDVRWHCHQQRDEFRIIGTEGEINLSPLNSGRLVWPGGSEELPPHENLHYPCIENFVSAVLDGAPLASTGATALWTDWVTSEVMRQHASVRP